MTILEHAPAQEDLLDFIDASIRQLQEAGVDAKYIIMGTAAYQRFRQAMAVRYSRKPKHFELYNYISVILDPFRDDGVCVLPGPGDVVQGVSAFRLPAD